METLKTIIERAVEIAGGDAALQMQIIRRILEDVYGGSWGVLIVKDVTLISSIVHWTIPDIRNQQKLKADSEVDGQLPAFCLHVSPTTNWQYNVFRAGTFDIVNRVTVGDVIEKLRKEQNLSRLSDSGFDEKITEALQKHHKITTSD